VVNCHVLGGWLGLHLHHDHGKADIPPACPFVTLEGPNVGAAHERRPAGWGTTRAVTHEIPGVIKWGAIGPF
jgi:hypothetical protein